MGPGIVRTPVRGFGQPRGNDNRTSWLQDLLGCGTRKDRCLGDETATRAASVFVATGSKESPCGGFRVTSSDWRIITQEAALDNNNDNDKTTETRTTTATRNGDNSQCDKRC